jgi:predicted ArsR family transcriptional regulator
MDITEIPDDAYADDSSPPDRADDTAAAQLFTDGPIRERLLDVVTGLHTPTKVAAIADRADCDTETARDYLEWFDEMGVVHRQDGRPVRYERNDAYFRWRRISRLREDYDEQEIVEALADVLDQIDAYREQYDADDPDDVSLVEANRDMSTEDAWEALSEWQTLERHAALLDAARRNHSAGASSPEHIDA